MTSNKPKSAVPDGVRYARWAGHALGLILICAGIASIIGGLEDFFKCFRGVYFVLYGIVLNLPFTRIPDARWKWAYGLLVLSSAAFVFVMVISVMFNYMEAAERSERLGIPGLEGTLISVSYTHLTLPTICSV